VKKLIALALLGIGAFAIWRKVQADRAELDLWTEATTADDDLSAPGDAIRHLRMRQSARGGELVSGTSPVSLVCCDVVGAVAVDGTVLERAFAEAIATQGVVTGTAAYVRSMVQFDRTRGWAPADVMHSLFPEDEIRAQAANHAFERSFRTVLDRFGAFPLPGANEALAKLNAAGTKLCLLSGLSRPSLGLVVQRLDWGQRADLVLCADDVARGFPWPDLVLTAILRLGVGDVRDVAVVSASESGVLAAHRAGARVIVGVLSGVHDASRLRRAGATDLLEDLSDLPDLLAMGRDSDPAAHHGE
jgi:phosphoglycolate phosphatase